MKSSRHIVIIFLALLLLQGCSVYKAANQPEKKNTELFKVGTHRDFLLAEFGLPSVTEERDGKKYEIFAFTQGYHKGTKAGRVFFHSAADIFTIGLWEVVGTPTEMIFDGTDVAYKVAYDESDNIEEVVLLKKK